MGQKPAVVWTALAACLMVTATVIGWSQFANGPAGHASNAGTASQTFATHSTSSAPPTSTATSTWTTQAPGSSNNSHRGTAIEFGSDAASISTQAALGVPADYGTIWVGSWTLKAGWKDVDNQLRAMRVVNVTPAIQLYYWGDDMSFKCVENGCAGKDKAGWDRLASELVVHLNKTMAGAKVLVLLETEFNKGSVSRYEPLDGMLADKARFLHEGYPAVRVVLAFGNWNPDAWTTWDRAVAASDFTGLQAMAGSTRDSDETRAQLVNRTLAGARTLSTLFGKPIVLQDLAFSSYPEPDDLAPQAAVVRTLFSCLAPLKDAGVKAILYRGFNDSPKVDLKNYYGQAERHFGLSWGGNLKPAGEAWVDGVTKERASAVQPIAGSTC